MNTLPVDSDNFYPIKHGLPKKLHLWKSRTFDIGWHDAMVNSTIRVDHKNETQSF